MANKLETYAPVGNGASDIIEWGQPFVVRARVEGVCPILFHAWVNEAVEEKAKAAKGSKAKKTDDVQNYVYRNEAGEICIPSGYFVGSIANAARFQQDPRSPRKSALDLYKAGVAGLEELCSFGTKDWDYIDSRRVTVQRAGITRSRPAFRGGWSVEVPLAVLLPEYITPQGLHATLTQAGKLIGVGDYRPTYGRYIITRWSVSEA